MVSFILIYLDKEYLFTKLFNVSEVSWDIVDHRVRALVIGLDYTGGLSLCPRQ